MSKNNLSAEEFDFVIVGAGASGCLLANRLTADGRATVCLLEAGPPDRNPYIHIPAGFIKLAYDNRYTWQFKTEPGPGTAGRRIATTQGKTLGGSTSVNGFNCTRGQPQDYDEWATLGNAGWSYAEVLPYFKRTERRIGDFDSKYRGGDGLLPITDCDWKHPLCDAFIEGAGELGLLKNPDYNGAYQEGVGYYQRWIYNGRRHSAAYAFLRPAMKLRNLSVRTECQATRVILEGKRAVGVEYAVGTGSVRRVVRARREVILCAGAANTPKLLMLSGIGAPEVLSATGIATLHSLTGVGENLQDHQMFRSVCSVRNTSTLNETARGLSLVRQIGLWCLRRPSILTISPSVAYGFVKSDPLLDRPDLQLGFTPGSYKEGVAGLLDGFPGMTLGFYQMRPKSAGTVRLASRDPFDFPLLQPNYLAEEEDQKVVIAGVRLVRKLLHSRALSKYRHRDESPPEKCLSDEEVLDFARNHGGTAYHLIGTCRMGPTDSQDSVVDNELRVIGLQGLRIADASIMPTMPSGNTQMPTMMIAEKAADMILGLKPPQPEYTT